MALTVVVINDVDNKVDYDFDIFSQYLDHKFQTFCMDSMILEYLQ